MLSWQQYAEAAGIFAASILLKLWSDRRSLSRIYHDDPELQAVVNRARALNASDPIAAARLLEDHFTTRAAQISREVERLNQAATRDSQAAARLRELLVDQIAELETQLREAARRSPASPGIEGLRAELGAARNRLVEWRRRARLAGDL
jgi:hypothetical protein